MGKKLILVAAIGALAVAYGCSSSGSSGGTTAASLSDFDYPLTSTDVATGSEVYAEFCEGCHPGGEEGDGPKIADSMESPAKDAERIASILPVEDVLGLYGQGGEVAFHLAGLFD